MGQTREALFESKNPVEKSETRPQTAFFYPLFSALKKKNKKYSEQRRNRERAHTSMFRETRDEERRF
jgi:hypothetical protein